MAILRTPVPELCREHGMSSATFYKWRRHGCVVDGSFKRAGSRKCTAEKMYAEERLKAEIIQEAMAKKW